MHLIITRFCVRPEKPAGYKTLQAHFILTTYNISFPGIELPPQYLETYL